ncbi:MAG: hypothetical protein ACI8Z9_000817 [Paraglaciecola sp.]
MTKAGQPGSAYSHLINNVLECGIFHSDKRVAVRYYVGAYASSPNTSGWDPALESAYYAKLKTLNHVRGLEHPFVGQLHAHDDQWFLSNIDPDWDFVFTCVPGIMNALANNPLFGIASDDAQGRKEALAFMQKACLAIAQLKQHLGRNAVQAIQVQTAPSRSRASSSAESLQASLETMLSWDWQGTQIVIEHCDALVPEHPPAKGFLSLEDEIKVLTALNRQQSMPLGFVINWGRSVLETRSTQGAIEHINQVRAQGLLSGVMFSGVSDLENEFGLWRDSHMPPAKGNSGSIGAEHSLMTEQEMHKCLAAADAHALAIVGIKLGIRPTDCPIDKRLAYNRDALAILERYFA